MYQESLVPSLIFKSGSDLELALLFAEEYRIPEDTIYKIYIQIELFQSKENIGPSTKRFTKLENIVKLITNKEKFVETLRQWYQKISPYDYEALAFVAQSITILSTDCSDFKIDILILEMLGSRSRSQMPVREELERNVDPDIDLGLINIPKNWQSARAKSLALQSTRLDFHHLKENPRETLSVELNEDNLLRLLPLIQILNVSADYFYEHIISKKIEDMVL